MAASTYEPLRARPDFAGLAGNNRSNPVPFNSFGYRLTLLYLVLLVARLPEITALYLGSSFYQILILNVVGTAVVIISGTLVKVCSTRGGSLWMAFHLWILFTLPFSGYRRGSIEQFQNQLIFIPGLFFVAGFLPHSIETMRKGLWAMAWAGFIALGFIYRSGAQMDEDRLVAVGSFSNSNLLAIYLLIMIPLWCWVVISKRTTWFYRALFSGTILLALSLVLKTGSRSGFLSIGMLAIIVFFSVSVANKAKLFVVGGLAVILFSGVMSSNLKSRIGTLFGSDTKDEVAAEARGSADERRKLLYDSIDATFRRPFVGSGFAVYSAVNATEKEKRGEHASWQVTHNMYTQISSELGLPGFFLYMIGLGSNIRALLRVRKLAKTNPQLQELASMAGAILCSWASFCFNGFFTSMALDFMLYLLAGFSIGISVLCENLLRNQSTSLPYSPPVRSPRFFPVAPSPAAPLVPVLAPVATATPEVVVAGKHADAPWRRNPRKFPPPPGTPSR